MLFAALTVTGAAVQAQNPSTQTTRSAQSRIQPQEVVGGTAAASSAKSTRTLSKLPSRRTDQAANTAATATVNKQHTGSIR
ncbi:hypothetical protein [Diaphorobacter caeni]|uniref:hypothetical protein n=1 Tax=Diaphorobacter caeni TaxID=2784387 RepID=UPI00188F511B|nr:hypothetical protein [Diaphorobacter caeni]MBF5005116.1 hypothetical protein [Diaphorobacter caeni]